MAETQFYYGCVPDEQDDNDIKFSLPSHIDITALPPLVDLRPGIASPAWNQSTLGSCTGQAAARLFEWVRKKQGLPHFLPSRLFIYYYERYLEGTVSKDTGAQIRSSLKVLDEYGVCPEPDWPYEISKFKMEPSVKAQANALIHRAVKYERVQIGVDFMRGCLAGGYPFIGGIKVYESFEGDEAAKTGNIPMPGRRERLMGGHAVFFCGYDDTTRTFIGLNSWGQQWGDHGFFYIPYGYLGSSNLCSDCWTLSLET